MKPLEGSHGAEQDGDTDGKKEGDVDSKPAQEEKKIEKV